MSKVDKYLSAEEDFDLSLILLFLFSFLEAENDSTDEFDFDLEILCFALFEECDFFSGDSDLCFRGDPDLLLREADVDGDLLLCL